MILTENKVTIYTEIFRKCRDDKYYHDLSFTNHDSILDTKISDILKAFALISKNRRYDDKIIDTINKKILNKISWYDYLETILNLFTEINDNLTEAKKIKLSDIYLPISTVDKMLDKYKPENFSNPIQKWFNPKNNNGNLLIRLIQRLLKGLENVQGLENEDFRYKWIVENMIHCCETDSTAIFNFMLFVDPKCEFDTNIFYGSIFSKSFDDTAAKKWQLDNYTKILGNPPYKKTLRRDWQRFIEKSTQISDYINFIVPLSLMWSNSKIIVKIRTLLQDKQNLFDNTIKDDNIYTANRIIFTCNKSDKLITKIILQDKEFEIKNTDLKKRIPESTDNIVSILNKIESKSNKIKYIFDFKNYTNKTTIKELIKNGLASKKQTSIFKYPVHHSPSTTLYAKETLNTWGKLKVAFNYSGKLVGKNRQGKSYMFVTTNLIGKQMVGVPVKNLTEADIIIHNYSSKIFQFYIIKEKSGGFNTGLHSLPALPLRKFTDKELYCYFGFTADEIKLIETTIK